LWSWVRAPRWVFSRRVAEPEGARCFKNDSFLLDPNHARFYSNTATDSSQVFKISSFRTRCTAISSRWASLRSHAMGVYHDCPIGSLRTQSAFNKTIPVHVSLIGVRIAMKSHSPDGEATAPWSPPTPVLTGPCAAQLPRSAEIRRSAKLPWQNDSRNWICIRSCGLVAITSASHAEGRQFDPGQVY
jgi:hypothetical protein